MGLDFLTELATFIDPTFAIISALISGAVALVWDSTGGTVTAFGGLVAATIIVPTGFAATNWLLGKLAGLRKVFGGSKK